MVARGLIRVLERCGIARTDHGVDGPYRTTVFLSPCVCGFRLRLHVFWRGDEDLDFHDHPFRFWTLPLTSYYETVYDPATDRTRSRLVRAWRVHRREPEYAHRLDGRHPIDGVVVTVVLARSVRREWGFWTRTGTGSARWVHHRDYITGKGLEVH